MPRHRFRKLIDFPNDSHISIKNAKPPFHNDPIFTADFPFQLIVILCDSAVGRAENADEPQSYLYGCDESEKVRDACRGRKDISGNDTKHAAAKTLLRPCRCAA